jgi:hypothetical protein
MLNELLISNKYKMNDKYLPTPDESKELSRMMTDMLKCFNKDASEIIRGAIIEYAEYWHKTQVNGAQKIAGQCQKQNITNCYNEETAKEELKELMFWYDNEFDKTVQEIRAENEEDKFQSMMESRLSSL